MIGFGQTILEEGIRIGEERNARTIAEKDTVIAEKDAVIAQQERELALLRKLVSK